MKIESQNVFEQCLGCHTDVVALAPTKDRSKTSSSKIQKLIGKFLKKQRLGYQNKDDENLIDLFA